jgi:hypothetical protein
VAWLHGSFVGVRDQPAVLDMAARLLDTKLPAELSQAVVESVFDYQQRWYDLCGGPPKPAFAGYSAAAQKALRAVAKKARTRKLSKDQLAAIDAGLAALPAP